jgi:hypothetical protein
VLVTKEEDDQLKKLDRVLRQSIETGDTETGLPEWLGEFGITPSGPVER